MSFWPDDGPFFWAVKMIFKLALVRLVILATIAFNSVSACEDETALCDCQGGLIAEYTSDDQGCPSCHCINPRNTEIKPPVSQSVCGADPTRCACQRDESAIFFPLGDCMTCRCLPKNRPMPPSPSSARGEASLQRRSGCTCERREESGTTWPETDCNDQGLSLSERSCDISFIFFFAVRRACPVGTYGWLKRSCSSTDATEPSGVWTTVLSSCTQIDLLTLMAASSELETKSLLNITVFLEQYSSFVRYVSADWQRF